MTTFKQTMQQEQEKATNALYQLHQQAQTNLNKKWTKNKQMLKLILARLPAPSPSSTTPNTLTDIIQYDQFLA